MMRRLACGALLGLIAQAGAEQGASAPSTASSRLRSGAELVPIFARDVRPRLNLPERERAVYADLLEAALATAGRMLTSAQYILVVDRSPRVQAALAIAAFGIDGEAVEVVLTLHPAGAVRRVQLARWGNSTDNRRYAAIPFGADVAADARFGGYTIPTQLAVSWWFGTDRQFEFIRVAVDSAAFA